MHGCLRSALDIGNVMTIDGLCKLADSLPRMHGIIANPAQFADIKAYLEQEYRGPGKENMHVTQFFMFVASRCTTQCRMP